MDYTTFPDSPKNSAINVKCDENGVELSHAKFTGLSGADKGFKVPVYWAGIGGLILMMLIVAWFGWSIIHVIGDPETQIPEGLSREGFVYAVAAFLAVVFAILLAALVGALRPDYS